jgi:dipeptidyl aminopeptidase/acylaminoacyl peptidase
MKKFVYYALLLLLLLIAAGCSLPDSAAIDKSQYKSATTTAIHIPTTEEFPEVAPVSTSTATVLPSITPSPTPTEIVFEIGQELTIKYLRKLEINSSEIVFHERLSSGYNYARHLVSYTSEGNQIYGLLTIPFAETPDGGFKAIVFNHGYIPPAVYQTTERYQAYVDFLARSGFVVFKIDYRGHGNSEGFPSGSYFSPGYTVDAIAALKSLQALEYVDPQGIGMWGHSMAGNLVLRAMLVEQDVKAGVIWAGAVYSYEDFLAYGINDHTYRPPVAPGELEQDEHLKGTRAIFEVNGWPDSTQPFWQAVSLTENIDFLAGPLQLHHAVDDPVVDINYSHGLAGVLLENGKNYEFYTYDGGGHNLISPWFDQAMLRTVQFFQDNL